MNSVNLIVHDSQSRVFDSITRSFSLSIVHKVFIDLVYPSRLFKHNGFQNLMCSFRYIALLILRFKKIPDCNCNSSWDPLVVPARRIWGSLVTCWDKSSSIRSIQPRFRHVVHMFFLPEYCFFLKQWFFLSAGLHSTSSIECSIGALTEWSYRPTKQLTSQPTVQFRGNRVAHQTYNCNEQDNRRGRWVRNSLALNPIDHLTYLLPSTSVGTILNGMYTLTFLHRLTSAVVLT